MVFKKCKFENLQQSLLPLFDSDEIEFHVVDRFKDEKDAKSKFGEAIEILSLKLD